MTQKTNYENLQIYQLAVRLADEIWKMVHTWNGFAKDTLGKQIVRSVDSIAANIAEGSGRGADVDNRRFLRMARGSLYETKHWLHCASRRGLILREQEQNFKNALDELIPKLNAYIRVVSTRISS